jgi:hypothetical protein
MTWALPPPIVTGKFVRAAAANQALTTDLPLTVHQLAYKAADQASTTTTQAAVTGFSFTMGPAELWYIEALIRVVAAAGSINIALKGVPPALSIVSISVSAHWTSGVFTNQTHVSNWPNTDSWSVGTTGDAFTYRGIIYTDASAGGTFSWTFAQSSGSASAITFQKGSNMQGVKIGPNPYVEV